MLKLMFMMLFSIPLSFMYKGWWLIQNLLYMMSAFMILMCVLRDVNYPSFSGWDVISYGLSNLSFWICALMIAASVSINQFNVNNQLF